MSKCTDPNPDGAETEYLLTPVKIFLTFFTCLLLSVTTYGQTSLAETKGDWTDGSSWSGGTAPPTSAANLQNITIDGYIILDGSLTSTSNFGLTVNAGDTLVIADDLTIQNGNLTINAGGVVLVFGNTTGTGNFGISLNGGSLVLAGEETSISGITTNGDGHLYVFDPSPSITGNVNGSNGQENEADLNADNPGLYDFVTGGTALPVTYLYVQTEAGDNSVVIRWATTSEKDNATFEIQRSANGMDYSTAGSVAGSGNSEGTLHYRFTDSRPLPGANYYRIRQVDTDGTSSISDVTMAFYGTPAVGVSIVPNPSQGKADLYLDQRFYNTETYMTILNADGSLAVERALFNDSGEPIQLPEGLAPGIYLVKLQNHFFVATQKYIVR
ncbi:MAG: T9SS type A sorting domain-containing protein [Cyclobacteriaceae bacterium]